MNALSENAEMVLDRLRRGPTSTLEFQHSLPLVHVAKQIWELRQAGHAIETRRLPNRVAVYELKGVLPPAPRQTAVFGDPVAIRAIRTRDLGWKP